MFLICKEYFMSAVLSFSSPRYAIIARLKVIYTKSRHTMVTQLNKIWRVWACARATAHATHGQVCNPNDELKLTNERIGGMVALFSQ